MQTSVEHSDSLLSDASTEYLSELRRRLLLCLLCCLLLFIGLLPFSGSLYHLYSAPIVKLLPEKMLLATNLISPVWIPIKLSFYCAALLTMPVLIYQLWCYFAPALYQREKRWFLASIFPCIAMFYCGMALAYVYVLPALVSFMIAQTPANVVLMPEISSVLSFSLKVISIFALCFQIPLLLYVCCDQGVLTLAQCQHARKIIIVTAFILAMLVTPPDVLSQIVVAIPMILLYELGLLAYRIKCYCVSLTIGKPS